MNAVIELDGVERVGWLAGGRTTRPLASGTVAHEGRSVGWRLSVADISAPCGFSLFAGMWRWSTVLSGPPVRLRFGEGRELTVGREVVSYSGEWIVMAHPDPDGHDERTEFLNLMVAEGGTGQILRKQVRASCTLSPDAVAVLVVGGELRVGDQRLRSGQMLAETGGATVEVMGEDASCIVVEVAA